MESLPPTAAVQERSALKPVRQQSNPNSPSGRDRRIKPRFSINVRARVKAQLFGTTYSYELFTENISETGLLLMSDYDLSHFNPSTILEIWLYPPDAEKDTKPIYFIAKYIRHAATNMIGVRISDIEPEARAKYNDFLANNAKEVV